MDELRKYLNNVAYMMGLALFLYFSNTESLSDEEFDGYARSIMATSKDNKCKQIYARS